jgi:hypothetical protein
MASIEIPYARRPAVLRRLVLIGMLPAVVAAVVVALWSYEAKRECSGAFSAGFGAGFDVYHCDLVLKRVGSGEVARTPTAATAE